MKKNILSIFFITLLIHLCVVLSAQTEKKPESLTKEKFLQKVWNYETHPSEVKYLGDKPCLIDFTADWCGWCRKIAPFMNEFCKTYTGEIYVYKINVDKEKELQTLFQAKNIPLVVFFPMEGDPVSVRGARSKEQYEKLINQILLLKPETEKPNQNKQ